MPTQHRILALVFHEFEALDLFGPLGAIVPHSDYYTLKLVNVHNRAAPNGLESSIKNAIGILPSLSLTEALKDEQEQVDTLFIPGGFGMRDLVWDKELLQQIGQLVERAASVFTVCTGSILLAATGKLDGRKATTNKRLFDDMTSKYPRVHWQKRARWVQDGRFLTASGITAGIDAGFAFLATTYVSPEDRKPNNNPAPSSQKATQTKMGDEASVIPGFDKKKALEYARGVAYTIEYRWHEDPADDPFVDPLDGSG